MAAIPGSRLGLHGIDPDAEIDDFFAVEPGGMSHFPSEAALVLARIVNVTAQIERKSAVDGVISEYRRAA
jgi:hypothetical protein